jgi:hypothetical protein
MCQMITAAHVRAQFAGVGRRVPRGYMAALDRLVAEIVARGVAAGEAPESAAKHVRPCAPLTGSAIRAAIAAREAAGRLDAPGLLDEARRGSVAAAA